MFDLGMVVTLLPLVLDAVELIPKIRDALQSEKPIVTIVKGLAPEMFDFFKKVGAQVFPELQEEVQAEVGATMFDTESVKWVQGDLNKRGAAPQLTVDGVLGPMTKAAVKIFQGRHAELVVDGWPGPKTIAKMKADTHP